MTQRRLFGDNEAKKAKRPAADAQEHRRTRRPTVTSLALSLPVFAIGLIALAAPIQPGRHPLSI